MPRIASPRTGQRHEPVALGLAVKKLDQLIPEAGDPVLVFGQVVALDQPRAGPPIQVADRAGRSDAVPREMNRRAPRPAGLGSPPAVQQVLDSALTPKALDHEPAIGAAASDRQPDVPVAARGDRHAAGAADKLGQTGKLGQHAGLPVRRRNLARIRPMTEPRPHIPDPRLRSRLCAGVRAVKARPPQVLASRTLLPVASGQEPASARLRRGTWPAPCR